IGRRKKHGCRPKEPVFTAADNFGRNILNLSCSFVIPRDLSSVNNVGVQRIGCDIAIFFYTYGMPFTEGDLAVIAPGSDSDRTALLLSSIDVIWKGIVRAHVIKLSRGLIVPGRKGLSTVDRDDGALVTGNKQDVRVIGIDPDAVIVVASRRALKGIPGCPAVRRFPYHDIRGVNDVLIFGVGLDLGKIVAPAPEPLIAVQFLPG